MLFRKHPFDADTLNLVTRNIIKQEYELPAIPSVSEPTADLLQKCLVKNPDNRITISELRQHPAFQTIKETHISNLSSEVRKSFFSNTGMNIYKQAKGFEELN
jgi:serine/threonine protein kinase